jgi:hypothetical protein
MKNLADSEEHKERKIAMERQMVMELRAQLDPRVRGEGTLFDGYPVASPTAKYYERFTNGEKVPAGWVNPSDYEAPGRK